MGLWVVRVCFNFWAKGGVVMGYVSVFKFQGEWSVGRR